MSNIIYKRTVKFHDAEDIVTTCKMEITDRNNFEEFTMCNERADRSGQTDFVPKEGFQSDLNNIWSQYHLNGMSAGLPIQTEAINKWKSQGNKYDYTEACEYLKEIGLYEVKLLENLPENMFVHGFDRGSNPEQTYRYGNGWLHCNLPDDFQETLNQLCDDIETEEQEYIDSLEEASWEDIDDEKVIALAQHLGLSASEALADIQYERGNHYAYSGNWFLICTDKEADEEWDEYMDNYIDECVLCELPEQYRNYFDSDAFKEDCSYDGRGASLSSYDGCENEEKVGGTWYFIYKQ